MCFLQFFLHVMVQPIPIVTIIYCILHVVFDYCDCYIYTENKVNASSIKKEHTP